MVRRHVPRPPHDAPLGRRIAHRLHLVSMRGWGVLMVAGVASIVRGWAYFGPASPNRTPSQLTFVEQFAPLWAYGVLWLAVGVVSVIVVLVGQAQRGARAAGVVLPHALAAAVTLNALWSMSYLWAQVQGVPRAYLTGVSYASIALSLYLIGRLAETDEGDRR